MSVGLIHLVNICQHRWTLWPADGSIEKSPKWSGCILWAPWMYTKFHGMRELLRHFSLDQSSGLTDYLTDWHSWWSLIVAFQNEEIAEAGNFCKVSKKSEPLLGKTILDCWYQIACLQAFILQNETTMAWSNANYSSSSAKLPTNRSEFSKIAAKPFRHFLMAKHQPSTLEISHCYSSWICRPIIPALTAVFRQPKGWRGD